MAPDTPRNPHRRPLRRHRRWPLCAARNLPTALRWAAVRRSRRAHLSASGRDARPEDDVLWQLLLTSPAEEICHLGIASPSIRSVAVDPAFIAAHRACHPEETLVVGARRTTDGVDVLFIDLSSGRLLHRVSATGGFHAPVPTKLDLLCFAEKPGSDRAFVMDPATGVEHDLPVELAPESRSHEMKPLRNYDTVFVFGRVGGAGSYKVLRVVTDDEVQLFEVLTLDSRKGPTPWRAVEGLPAGRVPPCPVLTTVDIDGVVYLLVVHRHGVEPSIGRFDLETEKWMPSLHGPLTSHPDLDDIRDKPHPVFPMHGTVHKDVSLAKVGDFLVVAWFTCLQYGTRVEDYLLDLWYLLDSETSLWERKYRIGLDMKIPGGFCSMVYLSSVLRDGTLLLCSYISEGWPSRKVRAGSEEKHSKQQILLVYDPETDTCAPKLRGVTDVSHLGVFPGSLLSIQDG
ncbi:unnamed protein product [Urochloa humidicola]